MRRSPVHRRPTGAHARSAAGAGGRPQVLRDTVVGRLDPALTVPARVASLITLDPRFPWHPPDPIRTIMAAPSFPQPMYAPLRDLSVDYILPGVEQVPANTVWLLQANHAFIEAYMVGTQPRDGPAAAVGRLSDGLQGSYFRQFWDVSEYVPQAGDPTDPAQLAELLKDIPPINDLAAAGAARHATRTAPASSRITWCCSSAASCCAATPTRSSTPPRPS